MPGYSVTFSVVDQATAQLNAINKRIAALRAPLDAQAKAMSKFMNVSGLKSVADGFKTIASTATSAAEAVGRVVPGMAALTGAATIGGMAKLITEFGGWVRELEKAGDLLNETPQQLAAAGDMMRRFGGNADDAVKSLTELANKTYDAAHGVDGLAAAIYQQMGVALRGYNGNLRNAADVQEDFFRGLDRQTNQMDRQRLAMAAGGEATWQVYQNYQRATKAGRDWFAEQKRISALTQEDVKLYDKYNEALANLNSSFYRLGITVGSAVSPVLTELFNELSGYIERHKGEITKDIRGMATAIENWVKGGGITRLTGQFETLATALGKVVDVGKWLAAHPALAGALLGAYAGGRVGGAYGAIGGAVAGSVGGYLLGRSEADQAYDYYLRHSKGNDPNVLSREQFVQKYDSGWRPSGEQAMPGMSAPGAPGAPATLTPVTPGAPGAITPSPAVTPTPAAGPAGAAQPAPGAGPKPIETPARAVTPTAAGGFGTLYTQSASIYVTNATFYGAGGGTMGGAPAVVGPGGVMLAPGGGGGGGGGGLAGGYAPGGGPVPGAGAPAPGGGEAGPTDAQGYASGQLGALQRAILQTESSGGTNYNKAPLPGHSATGPMQIIPSTFAENALPGEKLTNPADNIRVGNRLVAKLWKKYGGDVDKVAYAYANGSPSSPDRNPGYTQKVRGYMAAHPEWAQPRGPMGGIEMPSPAHTPGGGGGGAAGDVVDQMVALAGTRGAAVREFLRDPSGKIARDPDLGLWCAEFTNAALQHMGVTGTTGPSRLMAASFAQWGYQVRKDQLEKGDVLLNLNRAHVGVATGRTWLNTPGHKAGEVEEVSSNTIGPHGELLNIPGTRWRSDVEVRRSQELQLAQQRNRIPNGNVAVTVTHKNPPAGTSVEAGSTGNGVNVGPVRTQHQQFGSA